MTDLVALLEAGGPQLSGSIAEQLKAGGASAAAARQRISRCGPPVRKLDVHFPQRERFVYLDQQFQSDLYWERLLEAFRSTKSAFGLAVDALEGRGGLVPASLFGIVSGSPNRMKKHLAFDTLLSRGEAIGLFKRETFPDLGSCIAFGDKLGPKAQSLQVASVRGRLIAEDIALKAVREGLRKLGLASWDKIELRNWRLSAPDQPHFGQFSFDLCGPSYVQPLMTFNGSKASPGFVVADIALGTGGIDEAQVRPFLHKVGIMRMQRKTRPFLAMLIADHFSEEAFKLRSNAGVVFAKPELLFGVEIAKALSELIHTITHAAEAIVKTPEKVIELMEKLSAIEGAASNLRGPLFEMIVAHLVRTREAGTVEIGQKVVNPHGHAAEIDVLRVKDAQEVTAYECKGQLATSDVSLEVAERWLKNRVPAIRRYFIGMDRYRDIQHRFEFWTTGTFAPAARVALEKARNETKQYVIDFREGPQVLEYAKACRAKAMIKTLNEHFLKHPLATALPHGGDEKSTAAA